MKTWDPHIVLIREALTHIELYRPEDEATFAHHLMAQDAILMRLQTIGENLSQMRRIDEEAFNARGHGSWVQLIGLRNIISHGYHTVSAAQIWQIISDELPVFARSIEDLNDT